MRVSIHVGGACVFTRDDGKSTVANPLYNPALAKELGQDFWFEVEPKDFDDEDEVELPIKGIKSIQPRVYTPRLLRLESANEDDLLPILVRRHGDEHVVFDGNHRLINAIKKGRQTIRAKVKDHDWQALYEDMIERLMAGLEEPTTDEAMGHPFHGNQYTGSMGAKPEVSTAKGVKAGVAQLLASGHQFSVAELQKATGAKLTQQIHNAISDLKKSTPEGALYIHKHPDGGYSVKVKGAENVPVPTMPAAVPLAEEPKAEPTKLPDPFSGVFGNYGEPMKAPPSPLSKTDADAGYASKMKAVLNVVSIAAKGGDDEQHANLAKMFKESKAQAMAQWAADTNGKDMMPKPQEVFKADIQLVKDLAKAGGAFEQQQALEQWKKNSAGEKAGTWPPDPAAEAAKAAKAAAEKEASEKAKSKAAKLTIHTEPHFPTVPSYSPKGHTHVTVDDFIAGQATGKSRFEAGITSLGKALRAGHANAVQNKVGIQQALTNRLKESKAFQSLLAQRKLYAISGSLEASLISSWASSSGDHQPVSVANQLAIRDAFEMAHDSVATDALHLLTVSKASEEDVYSQAADKLDCLYGTKDEKATFKAGLRDFALAQYHETQDHFKAMGISEVYVARGMKTGSVASNEAVHGKLKLQPASSFSTSIDTARGFAGGVALYMVKVPASQVLSSFVTGFGCTNESEVVVLAHPDTEAIRIKPSQAGSAHLAASHVAQTLGAKKSSSQTALEQYEKAKAEAQAANATPPPAGSLPAKPVGAHSGHATTALKMAEQGDLDGLHFLQKELAHKKLPKTKAYIKQLLVHVNAAKAKQQPTAAAAGGVKKNAHYYKKLKEKVMSHPQHNEAIFSSMKSAGMTNEQVLSTYEKAYKEKFGVAA